MLEGCITGKFHLLASVKAALWSDFHIISSFTNSALVKACIFLNMALYPDAIFICQRIAMDHENDSNFMEKLVISTRKYF